MAKMQANYPKKMSTLHWDTLNLEYPTRKFPDTGITSETIGRQWRGQPQILKDLRNPINEIREYDRDYNITNDLTRAQTTLDFCYKAPETKRFNKHTSCTENHHIYPIRRRLSEWTPTISAHGTTEMKNSYTPPTTIPRLITDKDQFKHPASLPLDPPLITEPSWHKELEPLDTTHEGYEKYLDPYLTTSRLHHRPYTADQLNRISVSKDIITYYTFTNTSWVRTPKSSGNDWRLPISKPKSMYDREKFKEDFREIRTHNRPNWVSGSFRTETRDNYIAQSSRPESLIKKYEDEVKTFYHRSLANFPTNIQCEHSTVKQTYNTENSSIGSRKPLTSAIDQCIKKNKKLERIIK